MARSRIDRGRRSCRAGGRRRPSRKRAPARPRGGQAIRRRAASTAPSIHSEITQPRGGVLPCPETGTEHPRRPMRKLRRILVAVFLAVIQAAICNRDFAPLAAFCRGQAWQVRQTSSGGVPTQGAFHAAARPRCRPSVTSSAILVQKASRSPGFRLVIIPWSTTTSLSTHFAPALIMSVRSDL